MRDLQPLVSLRRRRLCEGRPDHKGGGNRRASHERRAALHQGAVQPGVYLPEGPDFDASEAGGRTRRGEISGDHLGGSLPGDRGPAAGGPGAGRRGQRAVLRGLLQVVPALAASAGVFLRNGELRHGIQHLLYLGPYGLEGGHGPAGQAGHGALRRVSRLGLQSLSFPVSERKTGG